MQQKPYVSSLLKSRSIARFRAMLWSFTAVLWLAGDPVSGQTVIAQLHPFWGVNAFTFTEYLPPTELQISNSTDSVSVLWPYSTSNAVLETTTGLLNGAAWTTVTNQQFEDEVSNQRSVTMAATENQQFFRLRSFETNFLPVFGFAIFFDRQLEFTWGPSLTIRGRTHANGPICLGPPSGNSLTFNSTVSTTSSILYSNLGGFIVSNMTGAVNYNGNPPQMLNTPALYLPELSTNSRAIIEMPPVGEAPSSVISQQRFYTRANVVLLISNVTVTLTVKYSGDLTGITTNFDSGTVPGLTNLLRIFPFLTLTNTFWDFRESKWVKPADINMGIFKTWLSTNPMVTNVFPGSAGIGPYPNIVYIGDFRTVTNLHAVRIRNGLVIATNGLTIATPNPLYVWGHYNCPNASHLGTTNTTQTFPASFICDAFTVLSSNWNDSVYSSVFLLSRVAQNTTVNAAVLAGTVYSTGTAAGQWSGGIHNFPRLLENWTSRTFTMNTSFVNLFGSTRATNQFQNPGVYYSAPTRLFNFDQNFNDLSKLPAGTPTLISVIPVN